MRRFWIGGIGRYVLGHPSSAGPLLLAGWALRKKRWWQQWPFLPLPDARYWEFRIHTMYGAGRVHVTPQEAVGAAKWAVSQRRRG